MAHDHTHSHSHALPAHVNRAFIVGIALNALFVIIEIIAGFYSHSLSLLSDAGHNLADVGALALSLLAFRLLKVKPTKEYTYGYRKTSVIVALFNAVVLLVSIGAILYEAVLRLFHPEEVPGGMIAIVAGIGIVINTVTALAFMRDKDKDLNVKSAYLHLLSDAPISAGIVVGGLIMFYTHWSWLDSIFSILLSVFILVSTWGLLKDSLRLSLDGVPADLRTDDVKELAQKIQGIVNIHHIHIWAISTTENALTAHVLLEQQISSEEEEEIKHQLRHELEHLNIHHATLETERDHNACKTGHC